MEKKIKKQGKTINEPLAMVSIPMQTWQGVYDPEQALKVGTIFEELDKPFFMGGQKRG